jgi:hypothetical protein
MYNLDLCTLFYLYDFFVVLVVLYIAFKKVILCHAMRHLGVHAIIGFIIALVPFSIPF